MPRLILDMADRRPAWAMPSWVSSELRAALPDGWAFTEITEPTDGSGDGATRACSSVLELADDTEIYLGYGVAAEFIARAPRLGWSHSGAAGVRGSISPELVESGITFTNSAGVHAPPMAETVTAMLLHFFRGIDFAVRNQALGQWRTLHFLRAESPVRELGSATVGIVGFGGVGRAVARTLSAFGSRVLAVRRSEVGVVMEDGAEIVGGQEALPRLLAVSDAVVLTLPETKDTTGMMDEGAFSIMKPGSVLVNVARGGVVREEALIAALRAGHLRGAGLDVFRSEPLPTESPLWSMPNVLITPHVSAVTRDFWRRELDLILHNLSCHLTGAQLSEWRNVVDLSEGY